MLKYLIAGLMTVFLYTPEIFSQTLSFPNRAKSKWIYYNSTGNLTYKTSDHGDRLLNFSYAGYMGGGVTIPSAPVKIALNPVPGDNTNAIQQAIDSVSEMPLVHGFRGAVLLNPGKYDCDRPLIIQASGVVLRGSGPDKDETVINMTGNPHTCIFIKGHPNIKTVGDPVSFANIYVPSGATFFQLANASGLTIGDTIQIIRPVTPAWVHFMGMDKLIRNGRKETWINGDIITTRIIRMIDGNQITVDIPLSDSYDPRYLDPPGASIVKISTNHITSQIGIENLQIFSSPQTGTINEKHNNAIFIGDIVNGWVRNINIYNTVNSVSVSGEKITLDNIHILHDLATTGAAKPADLSVSRDGSQILFNRCSITGDNMFFFATGAKVSGPIVLLHCTFKGNGWIQPHQRWATGLLVDNCEVPDGGIDFMNRGEMGSGHGWAIGWAVAWNCIAKTLLNQQPPGSMNWMIGCKGGRQRKTMPFTKKPFLPEGIYDAYNKMVNPSSLYLAQLSARLGKQALKNIGY